MYFIEKTVEFDKWLRKLKDLRARAKILFRIQKIESDGYFGDWKPVADGIREIRLISPEVTGCITMRKMEKLSFCSLVEINQLSNKTLKKRK